MGFRSGLWVLVIGLALAPAAGAQSGSGASSFGLSNSFNPAIGMNGLFVGSYVQEGGGRVPPDTSDTFARGFGIQELELSASSIVDPFFRLDGTLTLGQGEPLSLEEAYGTTLQIPGVTFKAGQFYADFGHHNTLHTHVFPFIDAPLALRRLLGSDGLRPAGGSASVLLPTPWFTEVVVEGYDAQDAGVAAFGSGPTEGTRDFGGLARVRSLFDLSDATNLEVGGSLLGSHGSGNETVLSRWGGDFRVLWRPPERARYTGIIWENEIVADVRDPVGGAGGFSGLRYQFAQQWWVGGRGEVFEYAPDAGGWERRYTGMVAFVPSEFSLLRLQASNRLQPGRTPVFEAALQLNLTIGAHPAHAF